MIKNKLQFNIYVVVATDEDGSKDEYQYNNYTQAYDTATTLLNSTFAPSHIDIMGYDKGNYYMVESL